jgi:predicted O-methyltransferase YrrM
LGVPASWGLNFPVTNENSLMPNHSDLTQRNWARSRAKREFLLAIGRKLAKWRILRIRNGHYYSPIPSLDELRRDESRIFDRSFRNLAGIELNETDQLALLRRFSAFYAEQPFTDKPCEGIRYFFDNYWYGAADALFLYSLIRLFRPSRIIEIGSGFSSAVMLDTNEQFMNRAMRLTFIEPDGTRLKKLLKEEDYDSVSIVEQRIQSVDPEIVRELNANDILFIDSSHVSKSGSDVNHILFDLLPKLAPGVFVHFHDILYPFEYPKEWFELGISWNEPYILRAFLQYNQAFPIRFWNDFMVTFHSDAVRDQMPLCLTPPHFGVGGSLWLQKA